MGDEEAFHRARFHVDEVESRRGGPQAEIGDADDVAPPDRLACAFEFLPGDGCQLFVARIAEPHLRKGARSGGERGARGERSGQECAAVGGKHCHRLARIP